MVYIYKKSAGKKNYYYLRISKRKGKKIITKDLAYLGGTIKEARKKLSNLSSHKEEIRKAYRNLNIFLDTNYYLEKIKDLKLKKNEFLGKKLEEIEACRLHFQEKFQNLDKLTKREIMKNFLIEFAYNSTSIEGNTINLEEAKHLLQEGLTPKDKTLREIYDLKNTESVFFELYESNFKEELTHNSIIKIHEKLMENVDARKGYRNSDVRVIRSNFDASPAPYVKTDMDLLLKWYKNNEKKIHPFVLSTIFHHKFEKIHPFMDGNGRTGRMIMNLILLKKGYPPIVIRKKFRKEYLDSMRIADKSNLNSSKKEDYLNLVQFSANELTENYWNLFL
ncbi:MAG: Fic family protein [Nanoarchaeota archaeon]|nr:Fic family protein [Nanoarchaeota archaeon]